MSASESNKSFEIGSVVWPATNSQLKDLGFDVEKRGTDCLGFVVESRSPKSFVCFPRLEANLWLEHNELADVLSEMKNSESYNSLSPVFDESLVTHPSWIAHKWITELEPIEIVEFQAGPLKSMWEREDGDLAKHYEGTNEVRCLKLGLAVHELDLDFWNELQDKHAGDLLFARFLPAGMHKIEIQLYISI